MRVPFQSLPLRYFLEVARTGSVNQAATQLHVAASAVSRQLAKLEESLAVPLFERQARGMRLTDAGGRLLAYATAQTQEADQVVEHIRGLAQSGRSLVRVASTEGFAAGFLPWVLGAFRQQHAQAHIHLQVGSPDEVAALVLRGEADLALKYSMRPEKGLQLLHSAVAPVCAILRPDHPLARQRMVTVGQVVQYPLLAGASGLTATQLFDQCCSMLGLHYTAAVTSNFSAALLPMVGGRDILLASYLTAAPWMESGHLVARPFEELQLQQRRLQVLALKGRTLPAAATAFATHLIASVEQFGKRKVGQRKRVAPSAAA
ncbi:MAG: LysR family transcriptional regulator [Rhodoferax sp.]